MNLLETTLKHAGGRTYDWTKIISKILPQEYEALSSSKLQVVEQHCSSILILEECGL